MAPLPASKFQRFRCSKCSHGHGGSLEPPICGVWDCSVYVGPLQFDPTMVEAKAGPQKDAVGIEDPFRDAALTEPADAAQPVPKLHAAGEVTP